jgi:YfiR/HmsC-like
MLPNLLRVLNWLAVPLLLCLPVNARDASEYEVKAAFLVNFTHFVEWPDTTARKEFGLCVIGADPFGDVLDKVVGTRTVNDKPIVIRRLPRSIEGASCQIAFVGDLEGNNLTKVLRNLETSHSLVVGDSPKFAERYGVIGFTVGNNRVGLALNTSRAEKYGLKINSQLMRVAKIVSDGSSEGRP